jgi:protein SCO1/2
MIDVHSGAKAMVTGGLTALLLLGSGTADAHKGKHTQGAKGSEPAAVSKAASIDVKLFDLELIDQHGRSAKFRSDVIGERIAVVNFIYTTCTTVCPVTSAIFGQVQRRLGARLGKDVFLVSVSVDPVTDRPARLKAYATKHKARSGWIWLTGNKLIVDKVLNGLGAYTPNYEDHPAMVLVGDGHTGQWARFFGFPSPDQLMAKVDALLAARAQTVSAATRQ